MKLTAKIITAATTSKPTNKIVLDIELVDLQALFVPEGMTLGEVMELKRLASKAKCGGHFPEYRNKFTTSIYRNSSFFSVEINFSGVLYTAGNVHAVIKLVEEKGLLPPLKDWSAILSAFSTVEEAIEAYPETRPMFEGVFGVGKFD